MVTWTPDPITDLAAEQAADVDRRQRDLWHRLAQAPDDIKLDILTRLAHDPATVDAVADALTAAERGDAS